MVKLVDIPEASESYKYVALWTEDPFGCEMSIDQPNSCNIVQVRIRERWLSLIVLILFDYGYIVVFDESWSWFALCSDIMI